MKGSSTEMPDCSNAVLSACVMGISRMTYAFREDRHEEFRNYCHVF
jgi:hypothetical protein